LPSECIVEEDNCEDEPKPKNRERKDKEARCTHSPAYIVVEEDYTDEESGPRGRLRLRHDDSDAGRYPLFPSVDQSRIRESRPQVKQKWIDVPGRRRQPGSRITREPLHRSPSPYYRYVQPPSQFHHLEQGGERRNSKHYSEDVRSESVESSRASLRNPYPAPARSMATRENSFDSFDSSRSHESSQRRRQERSRTSEEVTRSWKAPHDIHPRAGDERVVVTERYVYGPRRDENVREGYRREESADSGKSNYYTRSRVDFSAEDHAYYRDDWAREESLPHREDSVRERAPLHRRGYRRDRYQDSEPYSELSMSDSVEYRRACTY
jgi:hypothetical protein